MCPGGETPEEENAASRRKSRVHFRLRFRLVCDGLSGTYSDSSLSKTSFHLEVYRFCCPKHSGVVEGGATNICYVMMAHCFILLLACNHATLSLSHEIFKRTRSIKVCLYIYIYIYNCYFQYYQKNVRVCVCSF